MPELRSSWCRFGITTKCINCHCHDRFNQSFRAKKSILIDRYQWPSPFFRRLNFKQWISHWNSGLTGCIFKLFTLNFLAPSLEWASTNTLYDLLMRLLNDLFINVVINAHSLSQDEPEKDTKERRFKNQLKSIQPKIRYNLRLLFGC